MGLFSQDKKRKKSASPKRGWLKAKPAKRSAPVDRTAMWRKMRILCAAAAVIVAAAGVYLAGQYIQRQVAQNAAVEPQVVLHGIPQWMGPERTESIRHAVAAALRANPMDHAALRAAFVEAANHPWVAGVERITRPDADRVEVALTIRTPVALVGANNGYHLVDCDGHRLPGVYRYEELASLKLPAITGVASAPPAEGGRWPGRDVTAGVALAMQVTAKPWADQVEQVNVANLNGRVDERLPQLVLMTRRNGKINWGRPIGDEDAYEPTAAQKLANLDEIAFRYGGRVDAGAAEVDLHTTTPFIHTEPAVRYTSSGE